MGFRTPKTPKDGNIVRALWDGRRDQATAAGLRTVACTVPGCKAEDYWMEGDTREEKRARKWTANHKSHSKA